MLPLTVLPCAPYQLITALREGLGYVHVYTTYGTSTAVPPACRTVHSLALQLQRAPRLMHLAAQLHRGMG